MTDKSMFDILSKFDTASTRTVTESATATRSRSSSAGDPAMHDILSKFYSVAEAYPEYSGVTPDEELDTSNLEFDTRSTADRIEQDGSISDTYNMGVTQVSSPNVAQMAQQMRNKELQDDVNESEDQNVQVLNKIAQMIDDPEISKDDLLNYIEEYLKIVSDVMQKQNVKESADPVDTVTMDVPLLIRMLEFAREDASTDMDLHDVAEKLIALSANNGALTMSDYDAVVGGEVAEDAPDMSDRMQQLRGMRNRDAEANFAKTHAKYGIDGADMSSRMHSDALAHADEFNDPRKMAQTAMNMGMSPERVDRALPADFKFDEDVVSKDRAKRSDVVGKKTAVDDIVQELSKSYADFVAQVEEERDDMSFFKKDKK